ncbi:restriction endonuclease [Cytobacillus firmus]|uniref:restriction endonuclease n=1 Tax=Cytobacillus firmus TaxID=1399 RepID=UPI0037C08118
MGEAKDYTVQGNKVGRPDIQKLGGAFGDLKDIKEGLFFSATDYTKPAIKYA